MLAKLDRDEFMSLLEKLGDEDDQTVLTAARDIHARLTVAEISWDDLLVPDADEEAEEDDDDDDFDDDDDRDWSDEDSNHADEDVAANADDDREPVNDQEKSEALALIGKLAARNVSADTKTELKEYEADIAAGEFEKMDLKYLRALHARLAKTK